MYLDQVHKKKKKVDKEGLAGFFLSIIPVIGFVIFGLIPMILAVAMAFMDIKGFSFEGAEWAGLSNFEYVVHDDLFWKSIVNTLYLSISTFVSIIISLIIAFLLTKNIKGKKAFRTIYFIPYVCSVVAVTLIWQTIFNTRYGFANWLITALGGKSINWLGDSDWFRPVIVLIGIWSGTGYGIILYGAALTNVSSSLYEAAKVDGANAFKSFWHITIPAISPTTFYLLITGIIGALQEFARPQILSSGGGPDNTGVTVVFYLYRCIFDYFEMGYAAATAWLLAIFIVILTVINFTVSKLWVNYD